MIKIFKNYNLTNLNTFHAKVEAKFFVELNQEQDLKDLFKTLEFKENEKLFLGKGSNVLFTKNFLGIVVLNKIKGIDILSETENEVLIKSMGGEAWNDLVSFAVEKGYWGIENMTLIPGSVGAAPVQNIGAYGVEIKDILDSVEVYNIETGNKKIFSNIECEFGYRESVFKNKLKGKYFVSAIIIKLNKNRNENIKYKALQEYFDKNKVMINDPKSVSDAVAEIRKNKLPDPQILGNAGSFFKNVFIDENRFKELKNKFPDMPSFVENRIVKIPAGWLIERCGWKGKRVGNVGMYEKQALVLVNYGGATGAELKEFSDQIIDSVFKKFGIKIEREVNLI